MERKACYCCTTIVADKMTGDFLTRKCKGVRPIAKTAILKGIIYCARYGTLYRSSSPHFHLHPRLSSQVWPVYCHEETTGPYTRHSDNVVGCSGIYGRKKVVRLYSDVMDILDCLKQQVRVSLFPNGPPTAACLKWHYHFIQYFCYGMVRACYWWT